MRFSPMHRSLSAVVGSLLLVGSAFAQGVPKLDSYDGVAVRILQSNNAGTIQHVIDPATNKVTGLIRGCPNPHNVTSGPDGLYYYCANEREHTVDVFDTKTLKLVEQIQLSQRPNKVAVNKKHRKIYAGSPVGLLRRVQALKSIRMQDFQHWSMSLTLIRIS